MENKKRLLNIIFNKSGSGSISTKLAIPKAWIEKMEIDEENKTIIANFNEEKQEITIKKSRKISKFPPSSKKLVDNQFKIMYHMFCSKKNKTSTFSSVGRAVDS